MEKKKKKKQPFFPHPFFDVFFAMVPLCESSGRDKRGGNPLSRHIQGGKNTVPKRKPTKRTRAIIHNKMS
jgi:hypothetical protein